MKTQLRLNQLHNEFFDGQSENSPSGADGVQEKVNDAIIDMMENGGTGGGAGVNQDLIDLFNQSMTNEGNISNKCDQFFRLHDAGTEINDLNDLHSAMMNADNQLVQEINNLSGQLLAKFDSAEQRIAGSEAHRILKYRIDLDESNGAVAGDYESVDALDPSGNTIDDGQGANVQIARSCWTDVAEAELGASWKDDYNLDPMSGSYAGPSGIRYIRNGQKGHQAHSQEGIVQGWGDYVIAQFDDNNGGYTFYNSNGGDDDGKGFVLFDIPQLVTASDDGDYIIVEISLRHNDANMGPGADTSVADNIWFYDPVSGNLMSPAFHTHYPTAEDAELTISPAGGQADGFGGNLDAVTMVVDNEGTADNIVSQVNDWLTDPFGDQSAHPAGQFSVVLITLPNVHSLNLEDPSSWLFAMVVDTNFQGHPNATAEKTDNGDGTWTLTFSGAAEGLGGSGLYDITQWPNGTKGDIWTGTTGGL